jgi:PP-loop superfamily ATP-utilizing enzyme
MAECSRCLLTARHGVIINEAGICSECLAFDAEQSVGFYDERVTRSIIQTLRGTGSPDCVIAFSGGKDSAAALLISVRHYGLRPLAVMVDNGFIPQEVKEESARFCASLGAGFAIVEIPLAQAVSKGLRAGSLQLPCGLCIRGVFEQLGIVARQTGVRLVIGGHRFPPLTFGIDAYTHRPVDAEIRCISPLLSLRISERRQLEMLADAEWHRTAIAGNTSNCRLIGYFEALFHDQHGESPHVWEVSKEIRAGFYSRDEGARKVARPEIAPEHRAEVERKLGIPPGAYPV